MIALRIGLLLALGLTLALAEDEVIVCIFVLSELNRLISLFIVYNCLFVYFFYSVLTEMS